MDPLRVNARLVIPGEELVATFARAGGPGGQNVNKIESKVVLRFDVRESKALGETRRARLLAELAHRLTGSGELLVHASRHRHRQQNIADARERMALLLREALEEKKPRRATRPTAGSRRRRISEKKRRSEVKRGRAGGGE